MKRLSNYLADGMRVNENARRRSSEGEQRPPALGSFRRRMNKRYVTEQKFRSERAGLLYVSGGMGHIVELEGDGVSDGTTSEDVTTVASESVSERQLEDDLSRSSSTATVVRSEPAASEVDCWESVALGNMCTVTAEPAVGEGERQTSRESKFKENIPSPGNKRIDDHRRMDEMTRALSIMGLDAAGLMTTPEKKKRQPRPLVEPTEEFCALMLGTPRKGKQPDSPGSATPKKALARVFASPTKKVSSSPSPHDGDNKLTLPKATLQMVSVPRPDPVPKVETVKVAGTFFDILKPRARIQAPPMMALPAPPIPPRISSKLFSGTENESKDPPPTLQTLPQEVRKKIFGLLLVASHEILICTCGFCSRTLGSKQPALTQVSSQLRNEALTIWYGENKFMVRGQLKWNDKPPAWLQVLSQTSRDLVNHVEIETHDIASAVCMMATLGYQLSHRLPRKQHLAVMTSMSNDTLWMTFTSINKVVEEYARRKLKTVPSIHLWDEAGRARLQQLEGMDLDPQELDGTTAYPQELDGSTAYPQQLDGTEYGDDDQASIASVETAVLDLSAASEDVIKHGEMAREARRGKRAVVEEDNEEEEEHAKEEELDSFASMMFRKDDEFMQQRAELRPKRRFSVGLDMVRAVSERERKVS